MKDFINVASSESIASEIENIVVQKQPGSIERLKYCLDVKENHPCLKRSIPKVASLALLHFGRRGVRTIGESVSTADGMIYASGMLQVLWYAATNTVNKNHPHFRVLPLTDTLFQDLSPETIEESQIVFKEIVLKSLECENTFDALMSFLFFQNNDRWYDTATREEVEEEKNSSFRSKIFSVLSSASIKINRPLLTRYKQILSEEHNEEFYQVFLRDNPVFIDPIAAEIIPKQKFGCDYITDFVVRKHDYKYIVVEIEKPHDPIFTQQNDFTAKFTHAVGQVLDFLQWVDDNSAYARTHMPGISSPMGLLIIGKDSDLTEVQRKKLHRFNINSNSILVKTFDQLLFEAENLHKSIYGEDF